MELLRQRLPRCPRCTGMSVGRTRSFSFPRSNAVCGRRGSASPPGKTVTALSVRGRFAPHPNVWTFYLFVAFGLGFALLVGLTWGYAQWATE